MSPIKAIVSHLYARAALVVAIWGLKRLLSRPAKSPPPAQQPVKACKVIDAKKFKPSNPYWVGKWLQYDPSTSQQPACPLLQQWTQDGSADAAVALLDSNSARELFALDPEVCYLNHGSYGAALQLSLRVQQWYREQLERQPVLFMETTGMQHMVDALYSVAGLLGVDYKDLAPVTNATSAVNAVVKSLHLGRGDLLLMTSMTYPAVKSTLAQVAARAGANLLQVELDSSTVASEEATLAAFAAAIKQGRGRIRLAVVDHVVSFPPVVLPVQHIAQMCQEAGIPVLVDGAHAVGSMTHLDIPSLCAQYYTANLHKWLCTPKGCALLWVAPGAQAGVTPCTISHGHGMGYRGEFIWQGTQDSSAWLAAPACVEVFRALGMSRVVQRNQELLGRAVQLLHREWGTSRAVGGSPGQLTGCSMVAVELPELRDHPAEAASAMAVHDVLRDVHSIELPVAFWEGRLWVRLSAQMYNRLEDYVQLAGAVAALSRTP